MTALILVSLIFLWLLLSLTVGVVIATLVVGIGVFMAIKYDDFWNGIA